MPKPPRKIFERNQKTIHIAKARDVNKSGMAFILNDNLGEM
jgi:hypothetical protein